MFFAIKTTFWRNKDHFKRISSILDIEGSILDTVGDCENASRLGLRDSRRSRFSALFQTQACPSLVERGAG